MRRLCEGVRQRGISGDLGGKIKPEGRVLHSRQNRIDIAMLGIVSHSKLPIRIAAFLGFIMGFLSILAALVFTVLKLLFWYTFPMGIAPIVIGVFFLFGMQFLFMGMLGEYIGSIHTYVQRRPVVVEKERINF